MEKKDWKKKLRELSFMKGYYFKLEDNGLVEKKDDQLVFNRKDLEDFISSEVEKAEERGRTMAIHEISKTLDTEITRWRSDEDGEFDVLRIGFRYFRSTDVDDYSSSIEAISEEDFEDYESI
jgi:hypothetical protein